jgi:hypothetical protein
MPLLVYSVTRLAAVLPSERFNRTVLSSAGPLLNKVDLTSNNYAKSSCDAGLRPYNRTTYGRDAAGAAA